MKTVTVFLFVFLLSFSCRKSTEPIISGNERELAEVDKELIPLTIGNYWVFEERFSSRDSTSTHDYKSEVTAITDIGNYSWYEVTTLNNKIKSERYLMAENDSIYELQYNWSTPVRSLQYLIPRKKIQTFRSLSGGDVFHSKTVVKRDSTVKTPSGTYTKCYMFEQSDPNLIEAEIIKPGIGIIVKKQIYRDLSGRLKFIRTAKLKSFLIKERPLDSMKPPTDNGVVSCDSEKSFRSSKIWQENQMPILKPG